MATCRAARNAVEGDGGSLWRRCFARSFDTTAQHQVDLVKIKSMYQERKSVLHVIDPIFQIAYNKEPKVSFDIGMGPNEKIALDLLRELIIGE